MHAHPFRVASSASSAARGGCNRTARATTTTQRRQVHPRGKETQLSGPHAQRTPVAVGIRGHRVRPRHPQSAVRRLRRLYLSSAKLRLASPSAAADLHSADTAIRGSHVRAKFTHASVVAAPSASARPSTPRRHQTPNPAADPAAWASGERRCVGRDGWTATAPSASSWPTPHWPTA